MSLFSSLVDGKRIPYSTSNGDLPFPHPATAFVEPIQLCTSKAESQWVGALLIWFAAQGGAWHWVPWRMLRNEYMRYGSIRRLLNSGHRSLPRFYDEEPDVTWVMGRKGRPPETLVIGVQDLCERGFVSLWDVPSKGMMLFPTEKLIACKTSGERPETLKRQMFPLGIPKPA